jgi:hypothetical protein
MPHLNTAAHILPATAIDSSLWDICVSKHANGLIYAQYAYLQAICNADWHGWILGDYDAVWPIPFRKKFGIRYTYTPPFMQQTGIIGNYSADQWRLAVQQLHTHISYGDVHFNFGNTAAAALHGAIAKNNLVIDLRQGISAIRSRYRHDLQTNITKAAGHSLQYSVTDISFAVHAFRQQYQNRMKHIGARDFDAFEQLAVHYQHQNNCITRAALSAGGEVLAIVLLLCDTKRIYNLMNTTLPAGRSIAANHWLLDQVIAEFAGSNLLLDMEGSELPGVQQFYEGFGATPQPYFHYHFNRLPFPLRLLR